MFYYFLIEFLDELIFGMREAAWPLIRNDLQLTYVQIGLLLGLPGLVSSIVEPFLGVFSDRGYRRSLILGGGVIFALTLIFIGISHTFLLILLGFILFYPSSGAFVSLSQTELMDREPDKHEKNMARWAFVGSLGVVTGPLFLSSVLMSGGNWRIPFFIASGGTIVLLVIIWRLPMTNRNPGSKVSLQDSFVLVFRVLLDMKILRWLILLLFSDLMLDVLLGYLTLYFVDVVSVSQYQAGLAVGVWAVTGMVGGLLIIPLLDKIPGLVYLKASAVFVFVLFPLFLLLAGYWVKLLLLGCLGLLTAGWYSILKAQLYNSLPDNSGTVLAVSNIFGLIGALVPMGVGLLADTYTLRYAIWVLLLGPLVMSIGLPHRRLLTLSGESGKI